MGKVYGDLVIWGRCRTAQIKGINVQTKIYTIDCHLQKALPGHCKSRNDRSFRHRYREMKHVILEMLLNGAMKHEGPE